MFVSLEKEFRDLNVSFFDLTVEFAVGVEVWGCGELEGLVLVLGRVAALGGEIGPFLCC